MGAAPGAAQALLSPLVPTEVGDAGLSSEFEQAEIRCQEAVKNGQVMPVLHPFDIHFEGGFLTFFASFLGCLGVSLGGINH